MIKKIFRPSSGDLSKIKHLLDEYNFGIYSIDRKLLEWRRNEILEAIANVSENDLCYVLNKDGPIKGLILARKLAWDTDFFNINCSIVDILFSKSESYQEEIEFNRKLLKRLSNWIVNENIKFLVAKVDSQNLSSIHSLEKFGFFYMETIVTYVHDFRSSPYLIKKCKTKVRDFASRDLHRLQQISKTSIYDRFRIDPYIPDSKKDGFRAEWIKNICLGLGQNNAVLIGEVGDDVVGFITCEVHDLQSRIGIIKLVAVEPKMRGRGIGTDLVSSALNWFSQRSDIVYVSTQAKNTHSNNMYIKQGFKVAPAQITLHKWVDKS